MNHEKDVFEAMRYALEKTGQSNIVLKKEQKDAITAIVRGEDIIAVLPTGFGKSIIYQLLPFVFDHIESKKRNISAVWEESVVLVISPLNALMQDQLSKLMNMGLKAVVLRDDPNNQNAYDVAPSQFSLGNNQIIFSHPEVVVNNRNVHKVLKSKPFQERIKCIVVDEAHLVVDWKHFRPAYAKLDVLSSFFPEVPIATLTATATTRTCNAIQESIGLQSPQIIKVSPDRPNLYFASFKRPSSRDNKLSTILTPYIDEMKEKLIEMPMTLFYFSSLEECGESFLMFDSHMGDKQYFPPGADHVSANRLFAQYHAHYPTCHKEALMKALSSKTSQARVIFATIAFGMGVDIPDIRRVIHVGVPTTMEEYLQEAGRAGRDGKHAEAIIHWNHHSISQQRKGLQQEMVEFVTSKDQCKREMMLKYFGHEVRQQIEPIHICCDFHKSVCVCDVCLHEKNETQQPDLSIQSFQGSNFILNHVRTMSLEKKNILRQELLHYRNSLGDSRSCVGSISLFSGFSIELIDRSVELCEKLDSIKTIQAYLPVFSEDNAKVILTIIEKVAKS